MNKIFLTAIFWLLINLGLQGQNAYITKTRTIEKRTIYCQVKAKENEGKLYALIDEYFKGKQLAFERRRMFPTIQSGELSLIYRIDISSELYSDGLMSAIGNSELVNYVEYSSYDEFYSTPNDLHANQWHLQKIMAGQAWDIRTGDANIIVAVVDDAVDINHEDLAPVMHVNTAEIANNGVDDDGNGYVDDRLGWHSTYMKGNPNPPFYNRSKFSHGTHCAGIIGAATNNGIGIASLGYGISILPIACSDSTMPGRVVSGYEGIIYAVDFGANVISLSWGGSNFSNTGQKVIDYAISKNIVVVAAAGNDNDNIQKYPAAFNGVISVAATDDQDKKANFSNYGSWVDISAPGVDIWSTVTGSSQKYDYMSGTSMACPLVAGLCGLMLSQNSRLKVAELEKCLKSTADDISNSNPGFNGQLGVGRINAQKALQCIKPIFADFESDKPIACLNGAIQFTNFSSVNCVSYLWLVPGATPTSSTLKNPSFTFASEGFYDVTLISSDGVMFDTLIRKKYIEVKQVWAKMLIPSKDIKKGETGFLSVELNGLPPWKITYTDGITNFTIDNIGFSPFYFDVSPSKNSTYRLTSVSDANCSGVYYDSTMVNVDTTVSPGSGGLDSCGNFVRFTKVIDFGSNESPHFIYKLRDGNIAVVGLSNKGLIGGDDIFVSKFNVLGSHIWTKYYGTNTNEIGYPITLFDDKDHNLYVGGATYLNNPNAAFFFKLDSSGSIIYTRRSLNNSVQDQVRGGTQLSNGNIMYVGTSAITNDQAGAAFVMDATPNYVWKKSYNRGGQTEHNLAVKELNNKIYMLGHTSVGSGNYGTYMVKMNLDGSTIWQKYIDYSSYDAGLFEIITDNNTIMAVQWLSANGSSRYGGMDVGIIHMDTNGNRIWSRVIGTSGKDEASGLVTLNGHYYISGITNRFDNGNNKLFLLKLDFNGNLKWAKIYGKTGENLVKSQFGNLLTVGPDGSLMILAQMTNSTNDVVMFKVDECGNSNCPVQGAAFSISSDNTSISNSSLVDIGLLPITSPTNTLRTANSGTQISDNCPPLITKQECGLVANFRMDVRCLYDSVTFIDSSYNTLGKPIKNYKWIFHDGSFVIGRKVVGKRFNSVGVYNVKLIIYSDTSELCTDTIVKLVSVNGKMYSKISNDKSTVCLGDSVQVSISDLCGRAPFKIQWSPANLFKNPYALSSGVCPPISMWLKYTITDANNTSSKDSVYITVDPGCCAYRADFNLPKDNYCLGESLQLSLNNQVSGANCKWRISVNGVLIDSSVSNNLNGYKLNRVGKYTFDLFITGSCKSAYNQIEIYVHPLPFLDAGKDTLYCQSALRQIGMNPIAQQSYAWSPGEGLSDSTISKPIATVNMVRKYYLKVTNEMTGCQAVDSVTLGFDSLDLNLGLDTTICEGSSITFVAGVIKQGTSYNWNFGNNSPTIRVTQPGQYSVTKKNACGSVSDTVDLRLKVCFCDYYLPNAFSPDGNATNEYFPYENLESAIDLTIYNRWGEKLYEGLDITRGWDGTYKGEIVQQDVYMYMIKYKNCRGRIVLKYGTFTLLR